MEKTGVLILTVIAAPSGLMSSSLRSFLRTIPGVEVAAETACLCDTMRALTGNYPRLLLLDADLPGPVLNPCIRQFHADFPSLKIIVLTGSSAQQETALAAGADYALLKGNLDGQLRRAVTGQ